MVSDMSTSITGGQIPVGVEGVDPMYYDPGDDVVCFEWETPDGLEPGLFRLCSYGYNEIHIVENYDDFAGITDYHTYQHNYCFCRDSILVPNEAFLARGDGWEDAIKTVCDNYPDADHCDNIYPWTGMSDYPDWPSWVHVDSTIVDEHPHVNRFQITTFTNPDYTEGDDPLLHPYVETGGYPGDSLFILFHKGDVDSVVMHIEDEFGGDISGSNLEIIRMLDSMDVRMYMGAEHFGDNWVVDDQDNRYDGPVRVTFTTYRQNFADVTVITDHVTFFLLDTYDPQYEVAMTRMDDSPLRTCLSEDYPDEEAIWVTNADTVNLMIEWMETIFDQAEGAEAYTDYNMCTEGRVWEHLRLTIDGEPHHGFHVSDPNDLEMARLWQRDFTGPISIFDPFWLHPGVAPTYADFGDDNYAYLWTVSNDLRGQGIARILVKGRDHAGNILTYEEAGLSESYGKFVLVDVEAPEVDADLISITAAEFTADPEAFDDNFLGAGFEDPITGGYVYIDIWDRDHVVHYEGDIWVSEDGSVDDELVTLTAGDTVLVCATDLAGNETCVEVEVMPHEECCTYELVDGFNMIAISVEPVNPVELTVDSLFPFEDVYTLSGGSYIPVPSGTILNKNEGYLVMASVPRTVVLCGDPVESFEATGLTAGWNLIGGPWETTPAVDAGVYPAGAIDLTNLHYYDGETGEYVPTTEFAHCRGHLVMVTSSDTATVMVPDTASSKHVYVHKTKTAPVEWTARLTVESNVISRALTFGVAEDATQGIDLGHDAVMFPTLPGYADAYFDNHMSKSIVRDNNQVEWDLVLTDNATINIDLEGVPADWNLAIDGIDLRQTGSLNLTAGTHKVTASVQAVPENYVLDQNRPNPFNPTTDINYSVPADGHVKIAVYNVLGEEVKSLVDGVQEAGSRTVTWDGTDQEGNRVDSGIYFYKLNAGGFTETRKMTLIK